MWMTAVVSVGVDRTEMDMMKHVMSVRGGANVMITNTEYALGQWWSTVRQ